MHRHMKLLLCCLLLTAAGCSRSKEPTVVTLPQSATPQTAVAAASPANQDISAGSVGPEASQSKMDACVLLTSKDLQSVQGEALKETKPSTRSDDGFIISQCFYTLPTFTNSVSLMVAQRGESVGARDPKEFWKETFHRADESEKDREKDKDKAQASARGPEEEEAVPLQKIAGVGDDAYWTGNRVGGALYALKGNIYIRISVGGPGDQAAKIKKAKALAQIILKRL